MKMSDGSTSETLIKVLKKAFGQEIIEVGFEMEQLKGGTVGEVKLVYGVAKTIEGKELPYKVVYKRQKKWERYGDLDSWRREYDLYAANLDTVFSDSFRWPKCYYEELLEDETRIWMEYIEGMRCMIIFVPRTAKFQNIYVKCLSMWIDAQIKYG